VRPRDRVILINTTPPPPLAGRRAHRVLLGVVPVGASWGAFCGCCCSCSLRKRLQPAAGRDRQASARRTMGVTRGTSMVRAWTGAALPRRRVKGGWFAMI
jgi:hypothetical protein